jgi:hypothetical protein
MQEALAALDQQLDGLISRMDEISSRVTTLGERIGVDLTAGVPLLTEEERVRAIMREALTTDSGVVGAVKARMLETVLEAVQDGEVAAYTHEHGDDYAEQDHEHDDLYAEQDHEHDEYASTSDCDELRDRVEEVSNDAPDTEAINGRLDRLEERCDAAGRKLTE